MPNAIQYKQVTVSLVNRSWTDTATGDHGQVQNEMGWIIEICGRFGPQGWDLVAVVPQQNWYHLVFKRPGTTIP